MVNAEIHLIKLFTILDYNIGWMEEVGLMEVRALTLGIAGIMYKSVLSGIIFFFFLIRLIFSQKDMGFLAPGSAHSRPSARLPISMSLNFPAHVSAERFTFKHLSQLRRKFQNPWTTFETLHLDQFVKKNKRCLPGGQDQGGFPKFSGG